MKHEDITRDIIGAAMAVLNELKPGLDEKLYENALVIELVAREHTVEQQREFPVHYKGHFIGKLIPDLIVDGKVIADPKVVSAFNDTHLAQIWLPEHHRPGGGAAPQLQGSHADLETSGGETGKMTTDYADDTDREHSICAIREIRGQHRRRGEMSLVVPLEEIFANKTKLLANHESWERVELGKVSTIPNGFPFKSTLFNKSEGFPVIRIRDITRSSTETFYSGDIPPEYVVKRGDLLIGMDGNFRCCEWQGRDAGLNQRVCKITPDERILHRKFLLYGLNGYLKAIEDVTSSVTVAHLSSRDVQRIPFLLPPLAEQRRIVAKLETLLGKVDASQQRLAKIPVLLKRFRQSVLAAACSGRLTADWREEGTTDCTDDTDKKRSVRSAKSMVKEWSSEDMPELPETWAWVAFGEYARCFRGRFTPRPRNDPRYFGGKHPFIQIGNLPREGGFVTSHTQTLNDEGLAVSRKFPKGTVVIAIVGATIGNTGVLAYDMCVTDSLVGIETGTPEGNLYVEFFLRHKKHEIRQASYSSGGQPNIKLEFLNPYPLALPPLPEQQEIVRRVEGLFALADQLELRLAKARRQVCQLTPSLLARAFTGQLVPQDLTDEPAEELLERIRSGPNDKSKKTMTPGKLELRLRVAFLLVAALAIPTAVENWPAWRGPEGNGVVRGKKLPLHWNTNQNVLWRVPLPSPGNSTPVVWGQRVFITQAIPGESQRSVMCFDRRDGKLLWQAGTTSADKDSGGSANPPCTPSPVTDGDRVVVWFGSTGVFCFDMSGRELWRRDQGRQSHGWGYAASPVLHRNLCLLNFGPGQRSFLIALDKRTGQTVWQYDMPPIAADAKWEDFGGDLKDWKRLGSPTMPEVTGSCATPVVVRAAGAEEVVVALPLRVMAFAPQTGKPLWSCDGLNTGAYSSPFFGDGVLGVTGSGLRNAAMVIRPGGRGDVTATRRLWHLSPPASKSCIGSGVMARGHVYQVTTMGFAQCLDLQTGRTLWDERLTGGGARNASWSSPILANDRVYVPNQNVDVFVLRASPQFECLATNSIGGEQMNASLAVAEGEVFIRTHQQLWCISEGKKR